MGPTGLPEEKQPQAKAGDKLVFGKRDKIKASVVECCVAFFVERSTIHRICGFLYLFSRP